MRTSSSLGRLKRIAIGEAKPTEHLAHERLDKKTALAECRPGLENRFQIYVQHGQDREMPAGDDSFAKGFEDLVRDRLIVGSPDECVAELKRYEALGFNYVVLDFHWPGLPDELSMRSLKLIGEEKTTKELAALLSISVKTAESHRTRLMQKLDIHTTAGLVRYAIRLGLVEP